VPKFSGLIRSVKLCKPICGIFMQSICANKVSQLFRFRCIFIDIHFRHRSKNVMIKYLKTVEIK